MVCPQYTSKSLFRLYIGKLAIAFSAIAVSILVWVNAFLFVDTSGKTETISSLPFVVAVQGVSSQIQNKVEIEKAKKVSTFSKIKSEARSQ